MERIFDLVAIGIQPFVTIHLSLFVSKLTPPETLKGDDCPTCSSIIALTITTSAPVGVRKGQFPI